MLLEPGRPAAAPWQMKTAPSGVAALLIFMGERPGRWMQSVAPRATDRDHLVTLFRKALGRRSLAWLSAAAIYPELRWPLTLSLKAALADGGTGCRPVLDTDLLTVSRLPWFRRGWMPDWARGLFQQALQAEDRARGRTAILDALGVTGRTKRRRGESLDVRLDEQVTAPTQPLKADHVMLDFLWPALRRLGNLLAWPAAKRLSRKPIRRFAVMTTIGIVAAAVTSLMVLSLIPIDECDLLAASDTDNFRIGPGNFYQTLEMYYARPAQEACERAIAREPKNGRFWLQYDRSLGSSNPRAGFEAASKSAALGYPAGFNSLGFYYNHGIYVKEDNKLAVQYFKEAIARGNTLSLGNLARLAREHGNDEEALKYWNEYIDSGGPETWDVAKYYRDVKHDGRRYIELLKLGVTRGSGLAMGNLGFLYTNGVYVPEDKAYGHALQERGLSLFPGKELSFNVGNHYRNGQGVRADNSKATYWFIFSAKLGNAAAMRSLAEMMLNGTAKFKPGYGPPKDFDPLTLLRHAAHAGDTDAQIRLDNLAPARRSTSKPTSTRASSGIARLIKKSSRSAKPSKR